MDIATIRQNIEDLPDAIYDLEKDYLEKKAQLEYMSDLTKHLLAKFKNQWQGSEAAKEREALAFEGYRDHLEGIKEQAILVAQAAAIFHREERRFESLRSLNKNV